MTLDDLRTLGIPVSVTTLLRWEIDEKFPKRVRLGGTTICWFQDEILAWIKVKSVERDHHIYADPRAS